jgi:hypothetical protein
LDSELQQDRLDTRARRPLDDHQPDPRLDAEGGPPDLTMQGISRRVVGMRARHDPSAASLPRSVRLGPLVLSLRRVGFAGHARRCIVRGDPLVAGLGAVG